MATQVYGLNITLEANADLSTHQFKFVELDTDGRVGLTNGATDLVIGVLQNKPEALGEGATLTVLGVAKVKAAGTIVPGNRVGTNNAGLAVAKTADADLTCGIALTNALVNELVEILFTPNAQRAS